LLRATVFLLRFLKKIWPNPNSNFLQHIWQFISKRNTSLSSDEIQIAKYFCLYFIQHNNFEEVFKCLELDKKHCLIKNLGLHTDPTGLLRCGGRLGNSELGSEAKFPILLPKFSHLTALIVNDTHSSLFHSGVLSTLAKIREQFWIPQGRQCVKTLLSKCLVCKKFNSGPFTLPKFPVLPEERVSKSSPFTYVGVDYCGPLSVKSIVDIQKVWICLFVCFVTRAIHLEFVTSLSAQGFLFCLRRFIARRGKPKVILSDNAGNFKLAKDALEHAWKIAIQSDDVMSYCSYQEINWKFIVEKSPWSGGLYERMIGLVKNCLKKAVGRSLLTFEAFVTYLAEVEAIINSRPLTFLHEDINSNIVLRPVDFLQTKGYFGTEVLEENHKDPTYNLPNVSTAESLVKFWKTNQKSIDQFWKLWISEYLPSLREI
jgi:hypothetical protein